MGEQYILIVVDPEGNGVAYGPTHDREELVAAEERATAHDGIVAAYPEVTFTDIVQVQPLSECPGQHPLNANPGPVTVEQP